MKWKTLILTVLICVLCVPITSYAISTNTMFTGAMQLASDLVIFLTGASALFCTVLALKSGFAYGAAPAEEKPKYKKEIINSIILAVFIACAGSLISAVLSYF